MMPEKIYGLLLRPYQFLQLSFAFEPDKDLAHTFRIL